jgi:hypothetical protein
MVSTVDRIYVNRWVFVKLSSELVPCSPRSDYKDDLGFLWKLLSSFPTITCIVIPTRPLPHIPLCSNKAGQNTHFSLPSLHHTEVFIRHSLSPDLHWLLAIKNSSKHLCRWFNTYSAFRKYSYPLTFSTFCGSKVQ